MTQQTERTLHPPEEAWLDVVLGVCPPARESVLLAHARTCQTCEAVLLRRSGEIEHERAAFRFTRDEGGRLQLTPAGSGRADDASRAAAGERSPGAPPSFLRLFRPRFALGVGVGMAAAAVLALFFLPRGDSPRRDLPSTILSLPFDVEPVQRRAGSDESTPEGLEEALALYARGELEPAATALSALRAEGEWEILRRLYLGNALARLGRHAEAVRALRSVASPHLPDPWGTEARWTLYVSLRESRRGASADSLLRLLVRDGGALGARARGEAERLQRSR